jgi:hypothetical protein
MGSGLTKMLVVGLGKHAGASAYHAAALTLGYEAALMRLAKVVFARAPILGGVAIVENAMHDTARVEVLAADAIPGREPELCAEAATMMPALPFDEIDLLIVDQIGKNISGTGMDTNTIGRGVHGYNLMPGDALAKPLIWRIFVRGLTPETHGNAIGIGLAEATTKRLVAGVDAATLRTNVLTSRAVQCAKLPMDFATDAEAIRDSVLAVSGRLNPELYGLPIFPPLPGDIAETVKYSENKWDTQLDQAGRKRSIYIYQQRTLNMPFMQAFDSTVCDESRPRRRTSVTPLQALSLFNGDFVNEEADALAGRIRREAGEGKGEQVRLAYRLAFSRSPNPEEAGHFVKFLGQAEEADDALVGFCRVLLNASEFVYID